MGLQRLSGSTAALFFTRDFGIFFTTFLLSRNNVFNDGDDFFGFGLAKLEDLAASQWCSIHINLFDHVHDHRDVAWVGDYDQLVGALIGRDARVAFKVAFQRALDQPFQLLFHFVCLDEVELHKLHGFAQLLRLVGFRDDGLNALQVDQCIGNE